MVSKSSAQFCNTGRVEASAEDSFVTLSTCVSGNDYRARFVVIGRFAELEPIYEETLPAEEAGKTELQDEMNGQN